jgi:hypothetical protein
MVARAPGGDEDAALGWDSPDAAAEMLDHMVAAHADKLREMPVTAASEGVAGRPEGCDNLLQLCEKGAESMFEHATGAVVALRAELGATTQFPVLVAVDGLNALFADSAFKEGNASDLTRTRQIHSSELRLARAFGAGVYAPTWDGPFRAGGDENSVGFMGNMVWMGVARGSVVSALTANSQFVTPKAIKPPALAGSTLRLERYTQGEAKTLLSYWATAGICRTLDTDEAVKLRALTNGNGRELREIARSL